MKASRHSCILVFCLAIGLLIGGCDLPLSVQSMDFRPLAAAALAVHGVDSAPFSPAPSPVPKVAPAPGLAAAKQEIPHARTAPCNASCPCGVNGKCTCTSKPLAPSQAAAPLRTVAPAGISPAPAARSSAVPAAKACGPNGCAVNGVRVVPRTYGTKR